MSHEPRASGVPLETVGTASGDTDEPRAKGLLEVDHLNVAFAGAGDPVQVVRDVSFHVGDSEVVALVGESGSGKSITALSVLGLLPPTARVTSGRILFRGTDLVQASKATLRNVRGREIAMVFQDPTAYLNPSLTIGRQITESLEYHLDLSHAAAEERSIELLTLVGVPAPREQLRRYPHQFSGGMKQRVLIATALSCGPKLLIADEPTTALDVTIQAQILELLGRLRRELGMSIVLISHDLGVVSGLADRVVVMYGGRVAEAAPVEDTFYRSLHPYTHGILRSVPRVDGEAATALRSIPGYPPDPAAMPSGCAFHPRCEYARAQCVSEDPPLLSVTAEHSVACWVRPERPTSPESPVAASRPSDAGGTPSDSTALAVRGLRVSFPVRRGGLLRGAPQWVHAVDDVSFDIGRGETLSLVGESGCGKTTTGRAILQLVKADAGSVAVNGLELTNLNSGDLRRARKDMQLIFQDPYTSLNPRQRVGSILGETLQIHGVQSRLERVERIRELLAAVGLPLDSADRYPHQFSGGQRQRISIARALAVRPSLIVCDEPVSALDVSIQAQVVNLLRELQDRHQIAYLFIAHDLGVVRHISHRVAVMYLGAIVELGPRDEVYSSSLHPYTRALISAVPVPDPAVQRRRRRVTLSGDVPSPLDPPSGCTFRTRCPFAQPLCAEVRPALEEAEPGHWVSCHFWKELSGSADTPSPAVR